MGAVKKTPTRAKKPTTNRDAEAQLAGFLAKYDPEIEALAREARKRMQARLPGATELVYDNYNALAIGYGPSERASEAIFSIALYPRWVSLFFLQGARLPDPDQILKGSGSVAKHIVLSSSESLNDPAVRALMHEAVMQAKVAFDSHSNHRLIIKSIS